MKFYLLNYDDCDVQTLISYFVVVVPVREASPFKQVNLIVPRGQVKSFELNWIKQWLTWVIKRGEQIMRFICSEKLVIFSSLWTVDALTGDFNYWFVLFLETTHFSFLCCSESGTLVLCLNTTLVDECVIRPVVSFSLGLLLIVNSLKHSQRLFHALSTFKWTATK